MPFSGGLRVPKQQLHKAAKDKVQQVKQAVEGSLRSKEDGLEKRAQGVSTDDAPPLVTRGETMANKAASKKRRRNSQPIKKVVILPLW